MNVIQSKYANLSSGKAAEQHSPRLSRKKPTSNIGGGFLKDWTTSANEAVAYVPEKSKNRRSMNRKRSSLSGASSKTSFSGPLYDGSATESDTTFTKHPMEYSGITDPKYPNGPFEDQDLESENDVSVEMIYAATRNKLPRGQKSKTYNGHDSDNEHYWQKLKNLQGNLNSSDLFEIIRLYHKEYKRMPMPVMKLVDNFRGSIQHPRILSRMQWNKDITPQDLEQGLEIMTANQLFDFLEYPEHLSFECLITLATYNLDKEKLLPHFRRTLENELQNVQYLNTSYDTKLQIRRDLCNRAGDTGILPFEELISVITSQKFLVCLENNVYE